MAETGKFILFFGPTARPPSASLPRPPAENDSNNPFSFSVEKEHGFLDFPKEKDLLELAARVGIDGARKIGIGSVFDRRYGGNWVRPRAADVLPTRAFGLINPDQRSTVRPFHRDGISATKVEFARLFPVPDGFPLNRKAAFAATAGQSKIAALGGGIPQLLRAWTAH